MNLSRVSLVILTGSSLLSAGTLFTVGLVPNHQRTRDVIVYRLDAAGQTLHSVVTMASDPDIVFEDLERSVIVAASPTAVASFVVFEDRGRG